MKISKEPQLAYYLRR